MSRAHAILLALCASGAFAQDASPEAVEKATFRAICGTCHSTTLVSDLRTEAEWREEVDQMIKIGARGTEQQFERVMRYLERTLTIVNINSAEAPQIAPVLDVSLPVAEAIVKRRTAKGKFKNLEALKEVPGVEAAKIDARKDRIEF